MTQTPPEASTETHSERVIDEIDAIAQELKGDPFPSEERLADVVTRHLTDDESINREILRYVRMVRVAQRTSGGRMRKEVAENSC